MILGILSDSHDRDGTVRNALAVLDQVGATVLFHCGDVGGQDVFQHFVGRDCHFVWGNTDVPSSGLIQFLETVGLQCQHGPTFIELAGKRIALCHGYEREFHRLCERPETDYLFFGHTHVPADHRQNGCRFINPGALHRTREKTVAALDLSKDLLTYHVVQPG